MSAVPLNPDVKSFVLNRIDTIAELEILALCFAEPDRAWTASGISLELRSSDESASKILGVLVKKGFLVDLGVAFQCAEFEPVLARLIEQVILAYKQRRVSIITLIYDKPLERVKGFADAFKIRKVE